MQARDLQCSQPPITSNLQAIALAQIKSLRNYDTPSEESSYVCIGSAYVSPNFEVIATDEFTGVLLYTFGAVCTAPNYVAEKPESLSYILPYIADLGGVSYGGTYCSASAPLGDYSSVDLCWIPGFINTDSIETTITNINNLSTIVTVHASKAKAAQLSTGMFVLIYIIVILFT